MSYDQLLLATASIVQGCGSRESHVSPVTFNIDGQPISDNAASLSTMIGWSVKINILPSFDKWSTCPPDVMKEKVWDIVTNKYEIPIDNKEWVLMKKEDLESFIDMCSTYAAQEKSKLGKAAGQAMRCPHTSGRKGQARVANELRRKNPDKEITRTDEKILTRRSRIRMSGLKLMQKRMVLLHAKKRFLCIRTSGSRPGSRLPGYVVVILVDV